MKYKQVTFTPATASTTGFAASVTGATFTLTATTSGDGLAHKVTVLNNTATNHSAKNLTFIGTSQDGGAQTETISAPGASATVTTTLTYLTLTSVTISSTIGADTFSIGFANVFSSPTFPVNWRGGNASLNTNVTGTINYDLQQTFDDIQVTTPPFVWSVDNPATQAGVTAGATFLYQAHPKALRIYVNSYSAGAILRFSYAQRDE